MDNKDKQQEQELIAQYFGPNKESKKTLLVFTTSLIITSLIIGGIWFFGFKKSNAQNDKELLVIKADTEKIVIKPTDPEGEKIDHLDKSIYNTFNKNKDNLPKVEKIMDFEAEETKLAQENKDSHKQKLEELATQNYPINKSEIVATNQSNKIAEVKNTDPIKVDQNKESQVAESKINIVENKDIDKLAINNKLKKDYQTKPANANSDKSGIYIQLASLKNYQSAKNNLSLLAQKHRDLFGNYKLQIEEKLVNGKDKFYRIQLGQIENIDLAKQLCVKLNDKKENCFIVHREK